MEDLRAMLGMHQIFQLLILPFYFLVFDSENEFRSENWTLKNLISKKVFSLN